MASRGHLGTASSEPRHRTKGRALGLSRVKLWTEDGPTVPSELPRVLVPRVSMGLQVTVQHESLAQVSSEKAQSISFEGHVWPQGKAS